MCCKKNFLSYILKKKCLYSTYGSFLVINFFVIRERIYAHSVQQRQDSVVGVVTRQRA